MWGAIIGYTILVIYMFWTLGLSVLAVPTL